MVRKALRSCRQHSQLVAQLPLLLLSPTQAFCLSALQTIHCMRCGLPICQWCGPSILLLGSRLAPLHCPVMGLWCTSVERIRVSTLFLPAQGRCCGHFPHPVFSNPRLRWVPMVSFTLAMTTSTCTPSCPPAPCCGPVQLVTVSSPLLPSPSTAHPCTWARTTAGCTPTQLPVAHLFGIIRPAAPSRHLLWWIRLESCILELILEGCMRCIPTERFSGTSLLVGRVTPSTAPRPSARPEPCCTSAGPIIIYTRSIRTTARKRGDIILVRQ